MSVFATWEALNTKHSQISTGTIVTVSTSMPNTINSADLPLVLTIPGTATWNQHAGNSMSGLQRQVRTYTVNCYIKPVSLDIGPDPWVQTALVLIQKFGAAYVGDWRLGGVIDKFESVSDSGIRGDLTFGETAYCGFTFTLQVIEKSTST